MAPSYYAIPGFGPISIAWGWLLLGVLLGMLVMKAFSGIRGRRSSASTALSEEDKAQLDLILHIRNNGWTGLRQLADMAGKSETEFLYRLVGIKPSPAPGLGAPDM